MASTQMKRSEEILRPEPQQKKNLCVSCHDPFLENMRRALFVWLEEGDDDC
jgi:hypothetical protein